MTIPTALASTLISKYGRLVDYVSVTSPTVPNAGFSTDSLEVTAVFLEYTTQERIAANIAQSDTKVYIASDDLTFTPALDDHIIDGGDTYTIQNIIEVKPGESSYMYELQVRK